MVYKKLKNILKNGITSATREFKHDTLCQALRFIIDKENYSVTDTARIKALNDLDEIIYRHTLRSVTRIKLINALDVLKQPEVIEVDLIGKLKEIDNEYEKDWISGEDAILEALREVKKYAGKAIRIKGDCGE